MQEGENMQENELVAEETKKKSKKKKKSTKGKAKWLVPIIFVLVVAIVGLVLFQSVLQSGPVLGNRCSGVSDIDTTQFDSLEQSLLQKETSLESISIELNCKTIAIDIKVSADSTKESITQICENILLAIDEKLGLSKSNTESKYTDLFGIYNGKEQYHVDFVIEGEGDIYPIFASKHPINDRINFTYNEARDPELVEKLTTPETDEDTTSEE